VRGDSLRARRDGPARVERNARRASSTAGFCSPECKPLLRIDPDKLDVAAPQARNSGDFRRADLQCHQDYRRGAHAERKPCCSRAGRTALLAHVLRLAAPARRIYTLSSPASEVPGLPSTVLSMSVQVGKRFPITRDSGEVRYVSEIRSRLPLLSSIRIGRFGGQGRMRRCWEEDKQSRKSPGAKKLDGTRAGRKGEGDLRFPSWRSCSAMGVCSGRRVLDTRKRACGGHIKVRRNA